MEEQKTEVKIEEINKKLIDTLNLNDIEDLLKANEKTFEYEGNTYRAKKANYRQKQEAYTKRVEKFTELLRKDNYILEDDLRANYKKKGIDVSELDKKISYKVVERDNLMFRLGEAIKNMLPDNELQQFKKEIEACNNEIQFLNTKRMSYLEFSIENQVLIYTYSYLTFLIAEKKEGENWVRVWNTWEDYLNGDVKLINTFSYYCTLMNSMQEI